MRKLRIFSVLLLMISTVAFAIFQIYVRIVQDNRPPVLTCVSEEFRVAVDAPESELLKGVTAMDDKDGDVSKTLVVEKMSGFTEEGTRILTYAAVDDSKNVGRCERTLKYEGYEPPVFNLNSPLSFMVGTRVDVENAITASSVLDGDLSTYIKYTMKESINSMEEGSYLVEFRVMDSAGKIVYLETDVEIYGKEYMGIDVNLKEYLVYVDKGSDFNADQYYQDASVSDGVLTVKSNVNTKKPGTYHADYIVSRGSVKGKSRLVVVVQ